MPEIRLEKLSQKHLEGIVDVTSEAFYGEAITGCVYDFSRGKRKEGLSLEFRDHGPDSLKWKLTSPGRLPG